VLIGKADLKSVYRRAHLSDQAIVEILAQFCGFILDMLRNPFGGKHGPPQRSDISESTRDRAKTLVEVQTWPLDELLPGYQAALPPPKKLDSAVLFFCG
jgi:hypothetical protein